MSAKLIVLQRAFLLFLLIMPPKNKKQTNKKLEGTKEKASYNGSQKQKQTSGEKSDTKNTGKAKYNATICSEIRGALHLIKPEDLSDSLPSTKGGARTFVVALLAVVGQERGFHDGQFASLQWNGTLYPVQIVLVKGLAQPIAMLEKDAEMLSLDEGETVTVTSKLEYLFASEVQLKPVSFSDIFEQPEVLRLVKSQVVKNAILLKPGSFIWILYMAQEFCLAIEKCTYAGFPEEANRGIDVPGLCMQQTNVSISVQKEEKSNKRKITFDDIGGLKTEIDLIKSELDGLFGIVKKNVSKGILISGVSGSGKTLIGEALVSTYRNKCIVVDVDEVRSQYKGETEQNMKNIFQKATNRAPCIIFLDDLDELCTSRDKGGNSGIINALLHLMDGISIDTSKGVMVVATCTHPQALDVALRRPGRLSFDVALSAPDGCARLDILKKLLEKVPNAVTEAEIMAVSEETPGYVGGDLRAVLLEALTQKGSEEVSYVDIKKSLETIKPAAHRGSDIAEKKVSMEDIYGYKDTKTHLKNTVCLSLMHRKVFLHCGISPPSRFLLFGPPGCGKTMMVMAVAGEFNLSVVTVRRSNVFGKYFGESEHNLSRHFDKARQSAPCILLFENFDGLGGQKRSDGGRSEVEGRVINHLKVQLDGILNNDNIFIFAETNRPDLLDKDVIRPGRFHKYLMIDLPNVDDRMSILQNLLGEVQLHEGLSWRWIAGQLEGYTAAEICQFADELKVYITETGEKGENGELLVCVPYIEEVIDSLVPRTSARMLQRYKTFSQTYCPKLSDSSTVKKCI